MTGSESCDDGNTFSDDGCDANCTPSGCGNGVRAGSEQCDDGNLSSGDGCEPSCQYTVVAVAENVAPGGTVTTNSVGAATAAYPAQVSVTTPTGGDVSITKQASVSPQASGYSTLGMVIQIDAPPATSASDPLQIELLLDPSVIPPGATDDTIAVLKDGVVLSNCTGAAGVASPDPCIGIRDTSCDPIPPMCPQPIRRCADR